MRPYFEDRWTGSIYSLAELARLVEELEVPRVQVPRRFRALPGRPRPLLSAMKSVAALAGRDRDRSSAP